MRAQEGAHDVATVDVTFVLPYGASAVYPSGWKADIFVTVSNEGDFSESFNVTAYYNLTAIETQSVTGLAPGENGTLTFIWIVPYPSVWIPYPPKYTIWAEADSVSGETDTDDNSFVDGSVTVKLPGDVDGSGKVDYKDLWWVGAAYGIIYPDSGYNPHCDFNGDGKVDYEDLWFLGATFGITLMDS